MILPQLEQLGADMVEGEVVAIMRDFKEQKRTCALDADGDPLVLQGASS